MVFILILYGLIAWLSAIEDQSFSERVFSAYVEARGKSADPHIMRRAALAAEFALAQWLVKSLDARWNL